MDEPAGRFRAPISVPRPEHGTLLLADISGYTAFLRAVADAHAADMASGAFVPEAYPLLTSLLDGIVDGIVPPFELSEIEGDAVFVFAAEADLGLRGNDVIAFLARCYEAYRERVDAARKLMPCNCAACSSIGGLDLKFVMHHGDYFSQSIAGHRKVMGPEVTAAHLLLKNHVRDVIGRTAYALLTAPAAAHLEVPVDHARAVTEEYDHYPTIHGFVWVLPSATA